MLVAADCSSMESDACDCTRDPRTDATTDDHRDGHVLTSGAVLHAELPADLQATLGSLVGEASVDTLAEWASAVRRNLGGSIAPADLCHAGEETGHRGRVDGETYHFQCFYDAVALSGFVDEPVDIRTESPAGDVVRATADGAQTLSVTPGDAVFSFGVAEDVTPNSAGEPSLGDVYEAVCPYVKAFPDAEAYEEWAATVPAATVATPLAGATELAQALVE